MPEEELLTMDASENAARVSAECGLIIIENSYV